MAEETKKKSISVADVMGGERKAKETKSAPKGSEKKESHVKKIRHKHMHGERHDDGSFTMRYTGGDQEVSHAVPDIDGVHDSLEEHMGEPNEDEGQEPQPEAPPQ